jgi:hypothetical protein
LPAGVRLASRGQVGLNGQLLFGFFIWLFNGSLRSVGDALADTIVLYDPDGVLALSAFADRPSPAGA